MRSLPPTRNSEIVVQKLNGETLVYDLNVNKAYCLNETSSIVFDACGNDQTFEALKAKYNFDDDLIYFALDELKRNNLLEGDYISPFAGMNRREVIKKVGLVSMAALPILTAIAAPQAAQATSVACPTFTACRCVYAALPTVQSCANTNPLECNGGCGCFYGNPAFACSFVPASNSYVCSGSCQT